MEIVTIDLADVADRIEKAMRLIEIAMTIAHLSPEELTAFENMIDDTEMYSPQIEPEDHAVAAQTDLFQQSRARIKLLRDADALVTLEQPL